MAFVAEMSLGVASNLVFEALRRPFHFLSAELKRRDRVNKALADRPTTPNASLVRSDQALKDLSRIIGNSHGKLDENVAGFIRELRKTVIPETIANCALCGSDPSKLFPPFKEFFSRFSDLHFEPIQFFNAIYEACVARVEDVQDQALLEIIRAQHQDIIVEIDKVCAALILQSKRGNLNSEEMKECRLRVSRSIEAVNRYTNVETLQGTKKFRLKALAISGKLTKLSSAEISSAKISSTAEPLGYINFRRQFDRAVILGDPGGGKSTLTQLLCNDLANLLVLEEANPDRKDYDPRDMKLPLRLILRSFEARRVQDPSYTFFDYFQDDIKVGLDNDPELTSKFLQATLSTGAAVLIFDGLDEVLEVGERRNIVGLIEQFSEIYSGCPVLVTSRLVGYRDAPLCDDFETFGLAKFSEDDISKYCIKAIKAVSGEKNNKTAVDKSAEFLRQTAKIGGDLRENPLMLGLMVQIFVYRGDVPSNRPEVYKECATLMFEKWDGRRDIVVQTVPQNDMELLDVFGYVASRTFGDATNEEGVSKEWLTNELRVHFENWYIDKASAFRSAKSLVDFLTGRAWVMSEVGSGVFKFTHRTFLEYFFARNLISLSYGVSDLVSNRLVPHIVKNEWVVISHLALHMAVFRDGGKARQAGDAILALLDQNSVFPGEQERPLLEFVAGSLDYLNLPEAMYLATIERLMMRAVILGGRENPGALSVVWTIFQTARNRIELTKKATVSVFSRYLVGSGPSPELLFCMYILGYKQRVFFDFGRRPFALKGKNSILWTSLDHIRSSNKVFFSKLADKDISIAKAYVYLYGERRADFYRKFGRDFLGTSSSPLVPLSVDQVLSSSLEIMSVLLSMNAGDDAVDPCDVADCTTFISSVASDIASEKLQAFSFLGAPFEAERAVESLEMTIRHLWGATPRRSLQARETVASVLLCWLQLAESISILEGSHSARKRGMVRIPAGVVRQIAQRTGETIYKSAILDRLNRMEDDPDGLFYRAGQVKRGIGRAQVGG